MKTIQCFVLLCIIWLISFVNLSSANEISTNSTLQNTALQMRLAILNTDTAYLLKFVAPSGTFFIDTVYSRSEIEKMLTDKNSWLFKHLFLGDSSVKSYFKKAQNLKIRIFKRNTNAIMISYQSSNFDALHWIENCLVKVNDHWYFDGIFSCQ